MSKIFNPKKWDEPYESEEERGVDGCMFIVFIFVCHILMLYLADQMTVTHRFHMIDIILTLIQ